MAYLDLPVLTELLVARGLSPHYADATARCYLSVARDQSNEPFGWPDLDEAHLVAVGDPAAVGRVVAEFWLSQVTLYAAPPTVP